MPTRKERNGGKKKVSRKTAGRKARAEARNSGPAGIDLALHAAQIAVWEWDLRSNDVTWSRDVHKLFGLLRAGFDHTFETYVNMIHREDRDRVMRALQDAISNKTSCILEHRLNWADGSLHWVEMRATVTAQRGKALRITGTLQDITSRKLRDQDQEDWKTRHELVSQSAGLVVYDYDIPSGRMLWSMNSLDVLGCKPQELSNVDFWLSRIHDGDREAVFDTIQRAQSKLAPYEAFYRFQAGDKFASIHDRGFFIADSKGDAVRMLGIMRDVSDIVKNEKSIRENTRFRQSIENAMPGILYVYDHINRKLIYANRQISAFLGHSFEELQQFEDTFLTHILHPDDFDKLTAWTNEPDGTVKETEQRFLAPDGRYRWFLTRDTPFKRDRKGNVIQIIGIAQDITERKEVINQLNASEASFRELFDTVTEAIFIIRHDETLLDINKSGCQMFGYQKSDVIGGTFAMLAAEGKNDFEEIRRKTESALSGHPEEFEFWGKRHNGEIFVLEIRLTRGSYFGKTIIIGTGRDITGRRAAEQALRDSEQRFRILQQASFGGIGLHDQGVILDCNQGLADITGYSYQELVGSNGLELIAPEWRPFVIDKIRAGYEKPYDVEGIRKDGTRYFLEIQGKNIPFEGRNIRVTEFRNISERKKSEEKIVEQNARLQALAGDLVTKNNQLEEFTQIVSHNLRSPVGNIVTLVNLFESAGSEAERTEYINLLKESGKITLSMLNDINEVLKIKQNKNIEKQEVSFEKTFQQVQSMLTAKITALSAEIRGDFANAPTIQYPGIYLESIFLNLLDNALKYSQPGRTPRITFHSDRNREGHTTLEVKDNGLGINLERYGHQVFKLRKTFHRHPESRGIGLFMIKNQIEAMGGEISLNSREQEGSTFFINFNKHQGDI